MHARTALYSYGEFRSHWDRYVFRWPDSSDHPMERARRGFHSDYQDPKEATWKAAVFERIVRYYVRNAVTFDESTRLAVAENPLIQDRLLRALHLLFLGNETVIP